MRAARPARRAAARRRDARTGDGLPQRELRRRSTTRGWWSAIRSRPDGLVRDVPPCGHVAGDLRPRRPPRGVHKPPANEVLEGALRRCATASTTTPTAGSTTTASTPSAPSRAAASGAGRPHARAATRRGATSTCAGCSPMIERSARRADAVGRLRAERPAAVAATSIARSAASSTALPRRACSTASTAEEAYSVRCDETHQPAGEHAISAVSSASIGVQPPWPAEFVIVRIGMTRSGIAGSRRRGAQRWLRPVPAPIRSSRSASRSASTTCRPAASATAAACSSETEVQEYAEGGLQRTPGNFPAARSRATSLSSAASSTEVLWDWYDGHPQRRRSSRATARSSSTTRRGAHDLIEFQLVDAFPVKWVGPELSASANNVAVETLELAHQGLLRKR